MSWFGPRNPLHHCAPPPNDPQAKGQAGEDAALAYLLLRDMTLIERNFSCKGGEIDLIMQEPASLVFVEVRKRANMRHGGAAASIGPAKKARLIHAAQVFLQRYKNPPPCRFDVVAIDDEVIDWIKNAIEA